MNKNKKEAKQTKEEVFQINGEDLLKKTKEIIKEGNVRKITIRNKEGRDLLVLPLTFGVVGAVLLPTLAAVGKSLVIITSENALHPLPASVTVQRNVLFPPGRWTNRRRDPHHHPL